MRSLAILFNDIRKSLKLNELIFNISKLDLSVRYKRSIIGPFWIILSNVLLISVLSYIFSFIGKDDDFNYTIYMGIGLILWNFISSTINDSSIIFIQHESLIKQMNLPISFHIFRFMMRQIIVLLHSFILIPYIYFFYDFNVLNLLLFIFSVFIVCLSLFFISFIISFLSTQFRDLGFLIQNIMTVAFYASPILWHTSYLGGIKFYLINPFYHYISLPRDILMGNGFNFVSLYFILVLLVCSILLLAFIYKYKRKSLMFYV